MSFLKNNFDENIFSTIFLAQLILKIFLVKIFLAQFFLKIFFGENIFSKNIFGEKFFGINIFLGKGLHYPSHAHALLYPPPTYNSHPCYLKLRGGGRNKRTHGPDGAMVVPFIYIDKCLCQLANCPSLPNKMIYCNRKIFSSDKIII